MRLRVATDRLINVKGEGLFLARRGLCVRSPACGLIISIATRGRRDFANGLDLRRYAASVTKPLRSNNKAAPSRLSPTQSGGGGGAIATHDVASPL